jgi:hypothetical protein
MYGSIARYRLQSGMEAQLLDFQRKIREAKLPGLVGGFTYRLDNDPDVYLQAVVFESEEAYRALAASPEQDARYRELLAILTGPPEWHDGAVVSALP